MKLEELKESKVQTANGSLYYGWKKDLDDEEDENYLPPGYSYKKVLELQVISLNDKVARGKGYGKEIMQKFLATDAAKKAELIYLDINPNTGECKIGRSAKEEDKIMNKLENFYKQFGFRNKSKHMRMWLVNKGKLQDSQLPT